MVVGPKDQLTVMFVSYMTINAPCGLYKKPAAGIKPLIICAECNVCDLYLTVDGEPVQDGFVCCGDGSNDNAAAIKHAVDK